MTTELKSKQTYYEDGLQACIHFLNLNSIPLPIFNVGRAPHAMNKWQNIGLYTYDRRFIKTPTMWVDIDKTTMPTLRPSRIWSWPGYKVDRTGTGVVAHETGHHVSMHHNVSRGPYAQLWLDILRQEKAVSGYEPTPEESFAEAMRVYILNPHLLECGRPQRFGFFRQCLELLPSHDLRWYEVLANAPEHIRNAAENFANQKTSNRRALRNAKSVGATKHFIEISWNTNTF